MYWLTGLSVRAVSRETVRWPCDVHPHGLIKMVAIVSGSSLGLSLTSWAALGQRGALGSAGGGRGGEQAYVNIASGNLVLQRQDDFLAGLGLGLNVVRTYNSAGKLNDDNADNWSVGIYNQPLVLAGTLNA